MLSSLSVVWLPLGSKTAEQITLDIFQNCDVPEEESLTFDPEVDLNDDAVGKARYERFFFVRSRRKCDRNSVFEDVRESPRSRVGCL